MKSAITQLVKISDMGSTAVS